MGSTNFLPWNPTQSNQDSDAAYLVDAQRTGGAPIGTPFPSSTGNKLFFQLAAGMAALMNMMATKGYTCNDYDTALATVLANIVTQADLRTSLQVVPFSSAIVCNAAKYSGFKISLTGNTTISVTGAVQGQRINFLVKQDAIGGHIVTWPVSFTNVPIPDSTANNQTTIEVELSDDGFFYPCVPAMSNLGGIVATPIGQVDASSGVFSVLTSLLSHLGVADATTPAYNDNSTLVATTAWTQLGFGVTVSGNAGKITFPAWLGGLIFQWNIGTPVSGDSIQTVNWLSAFPNRSFLPWTSCFLNSSTNITKAWGVQSYTTSGVTVELLRRGDEGSFSISPMVFAFGQ